MTSITTAKVYSQDMPIWAICIGFGLIKPIQHGLAAFQRSECFQIIFNPGNKFIALTSSESNRTIASIIFCSLSNRASKCYWGIHYKLVGEELLFTTNNTTSRCNSSIAPNCYYNNLPSHTLALPPQQKNQFDRLSGVTPSLNRQALHGELS